MTVAILTLVETRGVGEKQAGTASGLFFAAAEIGGAGGPILLGVLYDATGGFDAGLYLLAGVGALLAVAALRLRRISEFMLQAIADSLEEAIATETRVETQVKTRVGQGQPHSDQK